MKEWYKLKPAGPSKLNKQKQIINKFDENGNFVIKLICLFKGILLATKTKSNKTAFSTRLEHIKLYVWHTIKSSNTNNKQITSKANKTKQKTYNMIEIEQSSTKYK